MDVPFPTRCRERFEPLRPLGAGGFGCVHLALQRGLDRQVVIKFPNTGSTVDPEQLERFRQEARVTSTIRHPHVVALIDFDVEEGRPWIAYEYVPGPTLEELAGPTFPWEEATAVLHQVGDALTTAHRLGIAHRDIKPANVLRTPDGICKVIDFGIARWQDERAVRTQAGTLFGTPEYMPPEYIRTGAFDPRGDLYALGATLYHLLAGHPPFRGDSVPLVLQRHLESARPSIRSVRPDVPTVLDRILRTLMAHEPAARPEALERARAFLEEQPAAGGAAWGREVRPIPRSPTAGATVVAVPPPPVGSPSPARPTPPIRGRLRGAAAGALVALAFAFIGRPALRPPEIPVAGPALAIHQQLVPERSFWLEVSGPVPSGSSVHLHPPVPGGVVVRPVSAPGLVEIGPLPRGYVGTAVLLDAAGRSIAPVLAVTAPPVLAILELTCMPSDTAVLVDFELEGTGEVTVEILDDRGRSVGPPLRGSTGPHGHGMVHGELGGLTPGRDYALEITAHPRWGDPVFHPVSTLSQADARVQKLQLEASLGPLPFGLDGDIRRIRGPHVTRVLDRWLHAHREGRAGGIHPDLATSLAGDLRHQPLARYLADTRADRARGPITRETASWIGALGRARLVVAADWSMDFLERYLAASPARVSSWTLDEIARTLRYAPERPAEAAARLLRAIVRKGASPDTIRHMVALDRDLARRGFREWILRRAEQGPDLADPDPKTAAKLEMSALHGLMLAGDEIDLDLLERLARSDRPGTLSRRAILALAWRGGDRARATILETLERDPGSLAALWASVLADLPGAADRIRPYLGAAGTDPLLAATRIQVVGLLGDVASIPALRERLDDPAPAVRRASLVALGLLEDRDSAPRVTRLLGGDSGFDLEVPWALGRLRHRPAIRALQGLLGQLESDPGPRSRLRMAVILWALNRMDATPQEAELRRLGSLDEPEGPLEAMAKGLYEGPFRIATRNVDAFLFAGVMFQPLALEVWPEQVLFVQATGGWNRGPAESWIKPNHDVTLRPFKGATRLVVAAAEQGMPLDRSGEILLLTDRSPHRSRLVLSLARFPLLTPEELGSTDVEGAAWVKVEVLDPGAVGDRSGKRPGHAGEGGRSGPSPGRPRAPRSGSP